MATNVCYKRRREEISLDQVQKTLIKARMLLCNKLRLNNMLPKLITEEAVTPNDATKIRKKDTDTEQVEALLDILARSPVSSYEVFMSALMEERPDLYKAVKAIEEEKSDAIIALDLECLQQELIDFYITKVCNVSLLPWFDEETRDMDKIYVSLELENKSEVLKNNEDLVAIKARNGALAKRILVTATVGSGKSTLLAKLAYAWGQRNPKSPLYKYDLLFILSLREIKKGCSIKDAIFQQILSDNTEISEDALHTCISSNSNVLFLLDGFDEYFAENVDIVQGEVDAMLNFRTFHKACVIVSSRPHKHLGTCHSLYTHVKLTGFSHKNITLYLSKFFNNPELVEGLRTKLSESDRLKSLSHIPIMLMLMCLLWEDSQELPNTQSELYAKFTKFLWQKFCHRYNLESTDDNFKHFLNGLGKVALDGLMPKGDIHKEKYIFCHTDFLQYFEQGCQVGLLTKERLRSKLTVSSAVTFLHKSFQEYCASYYCASLPDDQFDCVIQRIDKINAVENKLEILRFLCGTCDTDRAARIIHHVIQVYLAKITKNDTLFFTTTSYEITRTFSTGLSIISVLMLLLEIDFPSTCSYVHLTKSIRSLLSAGKNLEIQYLSSFWSSFLKSPLPLALNKVKSVKFVDNSRTLIINDAYPTELDIISETLIHMPNVHVVKLQLEMSGCSADSMNKLGICIGGLKNLSTLSLDCESDGFDVTPILRPISTNCEFQLQCLELKNWMPIHDSIRCDGDTINHLLAKQGRLQTLSLHRIELSNGTVESILDAINAPLCVLKIEQMHIGNAIGHIRHIIPHLHTLELRNSNLKEKDILTLGEFLLDAKHLSTLDLSHNRVGKAVCKLGCVIPQLEELLLAGAHLDEDDISTLSRFMNEAKCLCHLDLSYNNVGLAGKILCESLKSCSNLKKLYMYKSDLTEEDMSTLKEHLSDLKIMGP